MFDPITLGLIGSAIGGLTSKKPLKGALLGGALGAGGGLLAGGMGAAGAAGGAVGGTGLTAGGSGLGLSAGAGGSGYGLTASGSGLGLAGSTSSLGASPSALGFIPQDGGMMGSLQGGFDKFKEINKAAKPFGEAAGTAMSINSLFSSQDQPMQAPQLPQQMGAQTLQTLAQRNPQADVMQEAEMRRKRRMGLLGAQA